MTGARVTGTFGVAWAAAALLLLMGCGGQAATSAQPGAGPTSAHAESSHRTTEAAASASASAPVNESAFCPPTVAEMVPALAALRTLKQDPDGSGQMIEEFSGPRAKLHQRELQAPKHLRGMLHTEVAVLDEVIGQFESGQHKQIKLAEFVDAKTEFILACDMAE